MQKVMVGIRGGDKLIRADSDPIPDDEVQAQLALIAEAAESGRETVIRLPWLVVLAADVIFSRAVTLP